MYPDRSSVINGIIKVLRNYPDLLSQHLPALLKMPLAKLSEATVRMHKKAAFDELFTLIMSVP